MPRSLHAGGRDRVRRSVVACLAAAAATVTPLPAQAATQPAPAAWSAQHSGTNADLEGVSFTDPLHGHAVGRGGSILATGDGGHTWTQQFACRVSSPCLRTSGDRIVSDLLAVSFVDASHGWVTGGGGTILGTADGGASWAFELACAQTSAAIVRGYCTALSADRITKDLTSVSFVDSSHGWAAGRGETILHTDDGGHTWVLQIACLWRPGGPVTGPCPPRPEGTTPRDLFGVSFVDRSHGAAVGAAGYAFFTNDGGRTWTGGRSEVALDLHAVDAVTAGYSPRPMTVHAAGEGGVVLVAGARGPTWYGTGSGDEFSGQVPPTSQDLDGVRFTDRLNGWAAGAHGVIASTHDEGVTWNLDASGTAADLHGVSFPDANHGYAVGDAGTVLAFRATPAGLQVTSVTPRQLPLDGLLPVTITGRGFTSAAEVSFGKAWARGYTVDSDTRITAVPPRLPAGAVHVTVSARGTTSAIDDADAVTFAPTGGGDWTQAGRCPAKCNGAAVRLDDGRVLIVGARWEEPAPSTLVELYDPSSGTLRAAAPLLQARWDFTATLLQDGRVLVAGGVTGSAGGIGAGLATAELYDPRSGRWTPTGSMHQARAEAAATRLPNGDVLVTGGNDVEGKTQLVSAEVYNPRTGTWRSVAPMHHMRAYATALLLHTGQVLVAGNFNMPEDATAELYDPPSGSWRATGAMALATSFPTLVLLNDGRVLASGGEINPANRPTSTVPYAQIYNPLTGVWTPTGPMLYRSVFHAAATLPDGRVLVAGGLINTEMYCPPCDPLAQAELYDPLSGSWRLVTSMGQPEEMPALASLSNGGVVMAGSDGTVEVFTPAAAPVASQGAGRPWIIAAVAGAVLSVMAPALLLWRLRRARRVTARRKPHEKATTAAGTHSPPPSRRE